MPIFMAWLTQHWRTALEIAVILGVLLGLAVSIEMGQHYKAQMLEARSELATRIAAEAAQERVNEMAARAHQVTDSTIAAQLSSALDAAHLTGSALTERVLEYENTPRCALPGHPSPALHTGSDRGEPARGAGSVPAGVPAALASIPAQAMIVVAQLRACQATIRDLSGP